MTDPVTLTLVRYPPRDLSGRRGRRHARLPLRRIATAAASLLWLPAGFHLGLALAGGGGLAADAGSWFHVAALAGGGVPLALACRLLWRRGQAWAACAALAVLGQVRWWERWRLRDSGRSPLRRLRRRPACRRG